MKVAIIMGSKSDYDVVQKAEKVLTELGIEYETHIFSAHRTPEAVEAFVDSAEDKGIGVIIAAAGKAAHLAGVIAGRTILPVIGIPMKTSDLGGMDSLLSTVQMPSGVPVATVAIGGAENAAYLAAQILAVSDGDLQDKLWARKEKMAEDVLAADAELAK